MSFLKFTWKFKGPRIVKTIWGKINKVEEASLFDFKTYLVTVIKTVWIGGGMEKQIKEWFQTNMLN